MAEEKVKTAWFQNKETGAKYEVQGEDTIERLRNEEDVEEVSPVETQDKAETTTKRTSRKATSVTEDTNNTAQ
jgi:hypothetical protein